MGHKRGYSIPFHHREEKEDTVSISQAILYVSRIWLYMALGAMFLFFIVAYAEAQARNETRHETRQEAE